MSDLTSDERLRVAEAKRVAAWQITRASEIAVAEWKDRAEKAEAERDMWRTNYHAIADLAEDEGERADYNAETVAMLRAEERPWVKASDDNFACRYSRTYRHVSPCECPEPASERERAEKAEAERDEWRAYEFKARVERDEARTEADQFRAAFVAEVARAEKAEAERDRLIDKYNQAIDAINHHLRARDAAEDERDEARAAIARVRAEDFEAHCDCGKSYILTGEVRAALDGPTPL